MSQSGESVSQKHTVKVNTGSGVIIQPMTSSYAYILTAKHCLQDDTDSVFLENHDVYSFDGIKIEVLDYIYHVTKDIAILIVNPRADLELAINFELIPINKKFRLAGFPEDRRTQDDEYSSFIYKYTEKIDGKMIFSPEGNIVATSNVVGFSGGGLFTIDEQENPISLCAIETKMDGNVDREYHGKISAIPISEFVSLLEQTDKVYLGLSLSPILPLHLSSFEYLIDYSFNVINGWGSDNKLNFLKDRLREMAVEHVQVNLVPSDMLEEFKVFLTVDCRPRGELYSRDLWVALLELITVSILIDQPEVIDSKYVSELLHSRKLVYIGVNETWQQYISDVFETDLNELGDDGIIVFKTLSAPQRTTNFSRERVKNMLAMKNIGRPSSDMRSITNVNRNLSKIHSIVDIAALHAECIESKEEFFESHTSEIDFNAEKYVELRTMLANEYGAYLKVVGDLNDE
jgi:hypothetical protein